MTTSIRVSLIVHDQSSITKQPGECALYDPPLWLLVPPAHPRGTLNNFEPPATRSPTPVSQALALVGLVSPNDLESWDKIFQSCQKAVSANRVMHICRRDVAGEGQAQGIHQKTAFATCDTFVGVVATDTAGLFDGFHRLGVHNGRAWMWIPADPPVLGLPQRPVEKGPKARAAKLTPMIVHGLPRREIAGQIAPGAARTQQIPARNR
jgi:hypothetical protein